MYMVANAPKAIPTPIATPGGRPSRLVRVMINQIPIAMATTTSIVVRPFIDL